MLQLLPSTLAVVETITLLAYAAIAFTAAYLIARNARKKQTVKRDDTPTTITSRGEWLGINVNRFKAGPVFAWVGAPGDRIFTPADAGGKGGGGGGSPANYKDRGWHILSVGVGVGLYAITDGERVAWSGNLTPENTPDGTTVTTNGDGSFRVYWGTIDGNADALLSSRVGVDSAWPWCFHVVWDLKDNGSSPNWDNLEYECAVRCDANALNDSSYLITTDGGIVGINPAHYIYQLATAPRPMGGGIDPDWIDATTLEKMGVRCETEKLAMNTRIDGGQTVAATIDLICEDIGYARVQVGSRLAFLPIRGGVSAPAVSRDALLEGDPQREGFNLRREAKLLYYEFISRAINYRTQDVPAPNDGTADPTQSGQEQREEIYICSDGPTASTIAERRSRESLTDTDALTLTLGRDAVHLQVGQSFTLEDYGQLRVMSRRSNEWGDRATLTVVPDVYAVEAADAGDEDIVIPDAPLDVAQDLAVAVGQIEGSDSLVVFRIRAHQAVSAARVHLSSNGGSSYTDVGSQDVAASGGALLETLPLGTAWAATTAAALDDVVVADAGDGYGLQFRCTTAGTTGGAEPTWPDTPGDTVADGSVVWTAEAIDEGPSFEPLNDDATWSDLSGDSAGWLAGRQLMAINGEVFYVQSVETVEESDWLASTAYTSGDAVIPATGTTGLRYVATTTGSSDASEPTWPTEAGETVVDNGVTWEARRFAVRPMGLIRAREGTDAEAHAVDDVAFIIARSSLAPITDATITAGASLHIKTQPATISAAAPLSGATAVPITVV